MDFAWASTAPGRPSGTKTRTTRSGSTKIRSFVRPSRRSSPTPASPAIDIERAANKAKVIIHTSRPGIIIGKRGAGVDQLKAELQKLTENELFIDIQEIRKAETNAQLVAENIATQLERRVAFRRAMKKALQTAMKFGAKGVRVRTSGRLGGAEIARTESYREGRVPLHTLRADIELGEATAFTTYGTIGVKCWIFKGEIIPQRRRQKAPARSSLTLKLARLSAHAGVFRCFLRNAPSSASR